MKAKDWKEYLLIILSVVFCESSFGAHGFKFTKKSYNSSIYENAIGKTYVTSSEKMGICDELLPNDYKQIRYKIVSGDDDNFFKAESHLVGNFHFLSIRTRTGNSEVLNRESKEIYKLTVRATVKSSNKNAWSEHRRDLKDFATVSVFILDTNDLNPLFYQKKYDVVVPEDTPLQKMFITVSAFDSDAGINSEIYYSLMDTTNQQFAIHPTEGSMFLTRPLVFSQHQSHEITVIARDRGAKFRIGDVEQPITAAVRISVAQVNFHSPVISIQHHSSLMENSNVRVYAIVKVVDRDVGVHGEIKSADIVGGDPWGYFKIIPARSKNEYNIILQKSIDRETSPNGFNLSIVAIDNGVPPKQTTKYVYVKVADYNDHAPVFSRKEYIVEVDEVVPVNTPLLIVNASDKDIGKNARIIYHITNGDEESVFQISYETGLLTTRRKLDAENKNKYSLTISAQDQAASSMRKEGVTFVKIIVKDCNDNDPLFEVNTDFDTLDENEPVGSVIYTAKATDIDSGDNGFVSYSLSNLEPVPFQVDHFSGEVRTTKVIDYETARREYVLRIRASDWGLPYRRQAEMVLRIQLLDINDHRPQFEKLNCRGYLSRKAAIGTEIVTVSAIDFDAGNVITYKIMSHGHECFKIDRNTGVITLTCDLTANPEIQDAVINITATDGEHFADVIFSVKVNILNGRQNKHLFNKDSVIECEDVGVSEKLKQIKAKSAENNMNSDVLLEAPEAPIGNVFAPAFASGYPLELHVNESVAIGTLLHRFSAVDRDLGYAGQVVYVISSGNEKSCFKVDTYSGELFVMTPINYELKNLYTLNVTAFDLGSPQKQASVIIKIMVKDVNDNPPIFEKSNYHLNIVENFPKGVSVMKFLATDRDSGVNAEIIYTLVTDTKNAFILDTLTGVLTVNDHLDRETTPRYDLRVKANNPSTVLSPMSNNAAASIETDMFSFATVSVVIVDINDNPPKFNLPVHNIRIREDIPIGTVLVTVSATDPDTGNGGIIEYEQVSGSNDHFSIDPSTGTMRLVKKLDFELQSVYNVTIRAKDGGLTVLSSLTYVIVEIIDVNENLHSPKFPSFATTAKVLEGEPVGTFVGQVVASDEDTKTMNKQLSYSIDDQNGGLAVLGIFAVDQQGKIHTLRILDRETTKSYWLTIIAQDGAVHPLSARIEVYIEVLDRNDNAPQADEPIYRTSVPENSPPQTTVLTVQATDDDVNDDNKLVYKIKSGDPQGFFTIDQLTGLISTTNRRLDSETQSEHLLEVLITDNGNPLLSSSTRVVVEVVDFNDNDPTFLQRLFRVSIPAMPASETETFLCRVVASDPDRGNNARIEYSILLGKDNGRFRIELDTGIIYSKHLFNSGEDFELSIKASDKGHPERSTTGRVLLTVLPVPVGPGSPPVIVEGDQVVNRIEDDAVGDMVTLIRAEDPDGDQLWYRIIAKNSSDHDFFIQPDTPAILIGRPLDMERRSSYNLTIAVTDGIHTIYTWVYIKILDKNDHRPRFSQLVYRANVSENVPKGTEFARVSATDNDQDGRLVYAIHSCASPASLKKFRIDQNSGTVYTNDVLDHEIQQEHRLIVTVKDFGSASKRDYARLVISINDNNDHTPNFMLAMLKCQIHETAEVGTIVLPVKAIDQDKGQNAMIRYTIVSGNIRNAFSIDPITGNIRVMKELSRNIMSEYILNVKATDQGRPPRSKTIPVHIVVTIADDAPPKFTEAEYVTEVDENQRFGSYVSHVSAISKSSVFYSLTDGNGNGTFALEGNSGVLVLAGSLDYEMQKLYNLTVKASNYAGKLSFANVVVHVLDMNDNAPTFTSTMYFGNISESSPVGGIVLGDNGRPLVISANDVDSDMNSVLTYDIVDSSASYYFSIDSNTGAIRTTRMIDYEKTSSFNFEVQVWDNGTPRLTSEASTLVRIDVLDTNDCPPKFEKNNYNVTLLLPTYKDVSIIKVNAKDDDSPEVTTIVYSIIEGNNGDKFKIDSKLGTITVKEEDGLKTSYILIINASDGKFSTTTLVHINIKQLAKSGLKFKENVYISNIKENSTKVTTVAILTVLGNSLQEDIQFRILNPNSLFTIGQTSGMIETNGIPFDREVQGTYTLVVEAQSQASYEDFRMAHVLVHVSVIDVNDNAPMFLNLPYYSPVPLEARKGDFVARVEALDLDIGLNGEVNFELVRGHEDKFRIDSQSGEIFLFRRLQREQHNKEFKITVAATDKGDNPLRSEAIVSVRVINKNMPVFAKQFYTVTVSENLKIRSPVISIVANSPQNRRLIYSFVDGDIHEQFGINFEIGVIQNVDHLDHELKSEYSLTLRATDSVVGTYAEVPVNIKVTDENDNAPQFSLPSYNVSVRESLPFGSSIYKVSTTDDDSGINSRVQYRLAGNESFLFHIDPIDGSIYIKRKLDYEQANIYRFTIIATDMGTPSLSSEAAITINVQDMNDNPPMFDHQSYYCHLGEDAQRNQFITKVFASDPDISDRSKLRYTIVGGNSQQSFSINDASGVVRLTNLRKFKQHPSYTLNVSVSDGVYTSYTRVVIELLSTNSHTPRFGRPVYDVLIEEDSVVGTSIFTATATDADRGKYGQFTYHLQSDSSRNIFSIDSISGAVSLRRPLDREEKFIHEVPIDAVDKGGRTGYTLLRVAVGDVNDNAPLFLANEYKASINANVSIGTTILTVRALDNDQGAAGTVEYSLYEGDFQSGIAEKFGISASSGEIYLISSVSSSSNQVYQFFVRAQDKGDPQMETDVPIDVIVMGSEDVAPTFNEQIYQYSRLEDAPYGTTINKLHAESNVPVTYSLVPPGGDIPEDDESLFEVQPDGTVMLVGTLDREHIIMHTLTVKAQTQSSPPLVSFAEVLIHVMDINDNPPVFESNPYNISVAENAEEGLTILKVVAHDLDAGNNQEISYAFAKGSEWASNIFSLDRKSGWISTLLKLDRESVDSYSFKVVATDGGSPQLSGTATVIVSVQDYNDNPSEFSQKNYIAAVNEDALPGTVIISLTTTDIDLPGSSDVPIQFYIIKGDTLGQFGIRQTGEVYVYKELDRETIPTYELEIVATDGIFTTTTSLIIDILDANDNAPICFKSRYTKTIAEDTSPGTYVLTVEASDADEGGYGQLIYRLKGNGVDYFTIDEFRGTLKVAQQLDREKHSKYSMTAVVVDSARDDWFCSSNIEVVLTDVNDNAPMFTQEAFVVSIPEDIEPGMLVGKIHATDSDLGINRKISYSLVDSYDDHFEIDVSSGIIVVKKSLDREKTALYNFTVRADDHGSPSLSSLAPVSVIVTDVNDNHPEFAHQYYFASVSERSIISTAIITVVASSKDEGINAEIVYSILAGNEDNIFTINPKYGVVSVKEALDYETTKDYFLLIQAQDGGDPPLHNYAKLNISVSDANDNAPMFNQESYSAIVSEGAIVGNKVIQTVAGDLDSGRNAKISYFITRGDDFGQFSINEKSGMITVASGLDRELTPRYQLEVQARDKGLPTMSSSVLVDVSVADVNDNPPQFSQTNYSIVIQENKPAGSPVLQFEVDDSDEDENGPPFIFEIVGGDDANDFRMNENGRLITTTKFGGRHSRYSYNLRIQAFDNGLPPLYSEATVAVKIIEESQFPPVVRPLFVEVSSYIDQFPGGRIGSVVATDQDPYDKLEYELVDESGQLFVIDNDKGVLEATEGLDVGFYKLNISVSDGKFVSYGAISVVVSMVTEEMLKNSITVRLARVSPEEFIRIHRRKFIKVVKNACSVRAKDVQILSIQPAYNDEDDSNGRVKRQTLQDLDVLIAVRHDRESFIEPALLRRKLNDNLRRFESATRLNVRRVIRDRCELDTCNHGTCIDRLVLDESTVVSVTVDGSSFVSPQHHQVLECNCDAGYGGDFCDVAVNECANDPCPDHRQCLPDSSKKGFRCVCYPGKTGARCNLDIANCQGPSCHSERNPMSFRGTSYARYTLLTNVESQLTISLYVRTVQLTGCLMFMAGQVDYGILEMVNGQVQFKFDCGTGEGLVRVEHAFINDGNWHEIKLERHGSSAEIIIDQQFRASGSAPGHNDILNIDNNDIWFGAEVRPNPAISSYYDIRMGFYGCMDTINVNNIPLPLHVTGSNSIATLKRFLNVEFQCYETFDPGVCGSQPCKNGGTCNALDDGKSFNCNCLHRFIGLTCEIDMNPCASNPCLYSGVCYNLNNDYRCECTEGLSRKRCEFGRHCNPNPCQNGGICEEGTNSAICKCKGFQGEYCTLDINECLHNPCSNGGTCVNVLGSFECLCSPNMTGHLCRQHVTTPNIKSDSSNIYWDELIGIVVIVVAAVLIIAAFVMIIRRCNKRRTRRNNEVLEMTSNDIIKNKTNENNSNRISKMSNLEASYPGPPSRRTRPASYTPSTQDSYAGLNNFGTVRSYGSAADELENIPRYSQDFMQTISKPTCHQHALSQTTNDVDCGGATWDANLKDSYPEEKIQNDLKHKKRPVPDIPPSLQALNNMTVQAAAANNIPNSSNISENDELLGYHWDCSDWARSQNPLPNITEVSMQEVSDSPSIHSNESNTHVDASAAMAPLLDRQEINRHRPSRNRIEGANNPNLRIGSSPPTGETTRLLDPVSEFDDSDNEQNDPPNSAGIFNGSPSFDKMLNDFEDIDGDPTYEPSSLNYDLHPDEYLPTFNIAPNSSCSTPPRDNYAKDDNKYSLPRRRHTKLDDLASNRYSMGGYTTNGSCSDVSQNLCEIEDSEANISDDEMPNGHNLQDTRL